MIIIEKISAGVKKLLRLANKNIFSNFQSVPIFSLRRKTFRKETWPQFKRNFLEICLLELEKKFHG